MAVWLAVLVLFSTALYHRNDLTGDFAVYNQAWSLIGQGHLNPFSNVLGNYPFIKSDFELVIWPLALLHLIDPQPIVLLWVQDVAVAACGFVVFVWIADYLQRARVTWGVAVGVSVLVLAALVVNPGAYETLRFDFHIEPISTLFVLLAGRDLWSGRSRRAWIWIAIALSCGTFATITLVGLGLSALLAGMATRRHGVLVIAVAAGWLGLISLLGATAGSGLDNYAYLAGREHLSGPSGIAVLVGGMLAHPSRVVTTVQHRVQDLWTLIKPAGVVGVASAWGFGVPFVVVLTNVLNSNRAFIVQAYQNFAVFFFVLFGTVVVLVWLAQRLGFGWVLPLAVALVVSVQALAYGVTTSPGDVRWATSRVTPGRAAALTRALALTPPRAEVIATIGIIGRFAARPAVHWFGPNLAIGVTERPVVFVFDPANENMIRYVRPPDDIHAIAYARDTLHARVLVDENGVVALEWQPAPGTKGVVFPAPAHRP